MFTIFSLFKETILRSNENITFIAMNLADQQVNRIYLWRTSEVGFPVSKPHLPPFKPRRFYPSVSDFDLDFDEIGETAIDVNKDLINNNI